MVPRLVRTAVSLIACCAVVTGCAGLQQPDVERVASAFAAADPTARCGMLTTATAAVLALAGPAGCAETMARLGPAPAAVESTSVWGDQAQVRFAGDTMFLTRTSDGWKVTAAGCRPRGDAPYACLVAGP